jgi:hypothetical protein
MADTEDMATDEEGLTTPTSSDVGKQTLTKADLDGRDVTTDEGALEEAVQRGNDALDDDVSSDEDKAGYNPDAKVVKNPPDARVEAPKPKRSA